MIAHSFCNFIGFLFPLFKELNTAFQGLSLQPFLFFSIIFIINFDKFRMKDWAAPLIAAALFGFLSPGMLFQMPGKESPFQFMNMKTSVASMFVHAVIYALFLILFLVVLDIHLYAQELSREIYHLQSFCGDKALVLYRAFTIVLLCVAICKCPLLKLIRLLRFEGIFVYVIFQDNHA